MVTQPSTQFSGKLITLSGALDPEDAGITDAHNHIWIEPVPDSAPDAPVLTGEEAIQAELAEYWDAGGRTIVDCQPGGCGRNGPMMATLSANSGVHVIAATGYHLKCYYPGDHWLFSTSVEVACEYFFSELTHGLEETRDSTEPLKAGFIKMACEDSLGQSPLHLMEAAAQAARLTGSAVQIHTQQGADAEEIAATMMDHGLAADRIVLCHMDKRPDFELHNELAQEGVMLEYDTFFRPKCHPEENLWPLLERMIAEGLGAQVALATDMADKAMWIHLGSGPGLAALPTQIKPRLQKMEIPSEVVRGLIGYNIATRLARSDPLLV